MTDRACGAGLAGLLMEECGRLGIEVPNAAADRLRSQAMATAQANIEIERQLPRVIGTLQEAGVQAMLLKGAALRQSIYSGPELRPMSDVDILVRAADAQRAWRALVQVGCVPGAQLLRDDFFPRFHYEAELFTDAAVPVRIDLHCRPFRPVPLSRLIPESDWWDGATEAGPHGAFLPAPEVMLIHLAAHAAFHGCSRTLWLYDIYRWLEVHSSELDWDRFQKLCEKWRLTLAVRTALTSVESVVGGCVPRGVQGRLARSAVGARERWILTQAPRDAAQPIRHVLVNLLCSPGIRFRASYLAAILRPHGGHLGDLYSHRHAGWKFVAQGVRAARQVGRLVNAAGRSITRDLA